MGSWFLSFGNGASEVSGAGQGLRLTFWKASARILRSVGEETVKGAF